MSFRTTVDLGGNGWRFPTLSVQGRFFPFQDKTLANAIDRVDMHVEPLSDFPARQTHALRAGITP
jgi:hypothetical protein